MDSTGFLDFHRSGCIGGLDPSFNMSPLRVNSQVGFLGEALQGPNTFESI